MIRIVRVQKKKQQQKTDAVNASQKVTILQIQMV